jgi:hypothetical protein
MDIDKFEFYQEQYTNWLNAEKRHDKAILQLKSNMKKAMEPFLDRIEEIEDSRTKAELMVKAVAYSLRKIDEDRFLKMVNKEQTNS